VTCVLELCISCGWVPIPAFLFTGFFFLIISGQGQFKQHPMPLPYGPNCSKIHMHPSHMKGDLKQKSHILDYFQLLIVFGGSITKSFRSLNNSGNN